MTNPMPAGLAAAIARTPEVPVPAITENVSALVDELILVDEQIAGLEDQLKPLKAQREDLKKRRLPDAMQASGIVDKTGHGKVSHSSGATVYLKVNVLTSIKAENKDEVYTWLKLEGHDDLIQETINPQTLKAFVKERIEHGEPIPPGISTHVETEAVLNKRSKGKDD